MSKFPRRLTEHTSKMADDNWWAEWLDRVSPRYARADVRWQVNTDPPKNVAAELSWTDYDESHAAQLEARWLWRQTIPGHQAPTYEYRRNSYWWSVDVNSMTQTNRGHRDRNVRRIRRVVIVAEQAAADRPLLLALTDGTIAVPNE
jgi:hypothetical protein